MFKWQGPNSHLASQCCELEEEWRGVNLPEVEEIVEAAILRYQQVANRLMRQTTLQQLEMATKLMLVDAKEALARMNARFEALCREQKEKLEVLRETVRRKEEASK